MIRQIKELAQTKKATQGSGLSYSDQATSYGLRIVSVALLVTPSVALIVTGLSPPPKLPVRVVMMKVADVAPSGTVMLAGTVAFLVSPLRSVTDRPPTGAAPVKVTVPLEVAGAVTRVGLSVRLDSTTCV